MKLLTFSNRTLKEILRDPLNLCFGLGFPIVLLALLSAIQAKIPVPLFEITHLAPGISVFGLSFMTLFTATLVAKDRESAFLQRLYTTPLTAIDFIAGYALPIVPIAVAQSTISYGFAAMLGMKITVHTLYAILLVAPISLFYISLGLLCGSIFNVKQVGGICGALLTNVSAYLSGVWFDVELVGDGFKKFAYALPFIHAVEVERAVTNGNYDKILLHLLPLLIYIVAISIVAVLLFLRQMKKQ